MGGSSTAYAHTDQKRRAVRSWLEWAQGDRAPPGPTQQEATPRPPSRSATLAGPAARGLGCASPGQDGLGADGAGVGRVLEQRAQALLVDGMPAAHHADLVACACACGDTVGWRRRGKRGGGAFVCRATAVRAIVVVACCCRLLPFVIVTVSASYRRAVCLAA